MRCWGSAARSCRGRRRREGGPDPGAPPHAAVRHPVPEALVHDLRNPLNQIIGYAELLLEQATEAGHTDYLPYLRKVSAAGYRMLSLMDENLEPVREERLPTPCTPAREARGPF
jgi:hypothetical protein